MVFSKKQNKVIQAVWICCCCCCCSAYLSSCHQTASDANLLDDPHTFHYIDYFVIGGILTCVGVSDDPMFLWISSNSCQLNLLLVRSHQAEIIIVKGLIQGRNNVTRVRVELMIMRSESSQKRCFYPFDHDRFVSAGVERECERKDNTFGWFGLRLHL